MLTLCTLWCDAKSIFSPCSAIGVCHLAYSTECVICLVSRDAMSNTRGQIHRYVLYAEAETQRVGSVGTVRFKGGRSW